MKYKPSSSAFESKDSCMQETRFSPTFFLTVPIFTSSLIPSQLRAMGRCQVSSLVSSWVVLEYHSWPLSSSSSHTLTQVLLGDLQTLQYFRVHPHQGAVLQNRTNAFILIHCTYIFDCFFVDPQFYLRSIWNLLFDLKGNNAFVFTLYLMNPKQDRQDLR